MAYTTWIFDHVPTPHGKVEVRINVGRLGYAGDGTPAHTIEMDEAQRCIIGVGGLKKSLNDEDGLLSFDAVEIDMLDSYAYSGVSNSVPVSESFGAPSAGNPNSLVERIFFDPANTAPTFEVFLTLVHADASREVFFMGDLDPNTITTQHTRITKPGTTSEQRAGTAHLTVTSLTARLEKLTVADLCNDATYGLTAVPLAPPKAYTGKKFLCGFLQSDYDKHQYYGYDPSQGPTEFALAVMSGAQGVKLSALVERFAAVAGITTTGVPGTGTGNYTLAGSYDYYLQQYAAGTSYSIVELKSATRARVKLATADYNALAPVVGDRIIISGTGAYLSGFYEGYWTVKALTPPSGGFGYVFFEPDNPYSSTVAPYAGGSIAKIVYGLSSAYTATDLYVSLDHLFTMNTPIRLDPTTTLVDVLKMICIQLGSTARIDVSSSGIPTLVIEGRRTAQSVTVTGHGVVAGYLPTNWWLSSSSGEPRGLAKRCVKITNAHDSGKVFAPISHQDSLDFEVKWRARKYGTSAADMTYDAKLSLSDQAKLFDGSPTPADAWIGGTFLYIYDATDSVFDSTYNTLYGLTTGNFYAVAMCVRHGMTPVLGDNHHNTSVSAAEFYQQELLYDKYVLKRTFATAAADDAGLVGPVRPGVWSSLFYRAAVRNFRMIDTVQDVFADTLEATFVELPADYTTLPVPPIVIEDETTSTTGGATSTSTSTRNDTSNTTVVVGSYNIDKRVLNFYSAAAIARTATATVFSASGIPQYGFMVESGAGEHVNAFIQFRKAKYNSEVGNVEVVGVSAAGVPDYFVSGTAMFAEGEDTGGSPTNRYYVSRPFFWSEDQGKFVWARTTEHTAINRRQYVHGRIVMERDAFGVTTLSWSNLGSALRPSSDKEILTLKGAELGSYPETEPAAYNTLPQTLPAYKLPRLFLGATGNTSDRVTVVFPTGQKPMIFSAASWYYPTVDPWQREVFASPPTIGFANGIANPLAFDIDMSLRDYNAVAGAPPPPNNTVYNRDNPTNPAVIDLSSQMIIDVWGYVEVTGEDAHLH